MPLSRKLVLLFAVLLPLSALGAPAFAEPEPTAPLENVRLQLKWRHQFQFAGYYAAIEQGFYRDAGLKVELIQAEPGDAPMQAVIDGKAEFGVGTTDLLLMRDAGIPVVVLAAIFQHSPLALMVRKDSGVANIHELARGSVMIEPHSAELFAFLTNEGVPLQRLRLEEHSFDTAALLEGSIDAMSVYSTDEPYDLISRGVPYLLFKPIESGIDFYGDNLFTTRAQIESHPERVRSFVEASVKGWKYAMAHPREIAELIATRYGSRKSLERLLFEAEAMQPLINANIIEVGYINPGRWERIAQRYAELGMIRPDLNLSGFVYDQDPAADYGFFYRLFAVVGGLAAVLAALVFWYKRMNRRLRGEVVERSEAQAELERLNGQKNLLLSIIGHDLRSAFNVLLCYGELLVNDGAAMDKTRLAGIHKSVRDAATAAYSLLNNLLEWASLQNGKGQTLAATVAVAPLIDQVVLMLGPQAAAKNVEIRVVANAATTIHADPRMAETILRNLVGNAIKFTPPGGCVSVGVRNADGETEVSITDTGIGIAPERLERLFEIEAKSPVSGTAGEQGSGLGLVLCRDLAAANRGKLRIDSDAGVGTRVLLTLPACEEPLAA